MSAANDGEKRKKFRINDLSEEQRKSLFIFLVAILMIIVTVVWLALLKNTIDRQAANLPKDDKQWESLKADLNSLLKGTTEGLEAIKDVTNQTTTQPLNTEQINALKEKIIASQANGWSIFISNSNNFRLKYPTDWFLNLPPDQANQDFIVKLSPNASSTKAVVIKNYSSLAEFSSLNNVKKYWPQDSGYLVLFDLLNNTTTDIISNTFELIPTPILEKTL